MKTQQQQQQQQPPSIRRAATLHSVATTVAPPPSSIKLTGTKFIVPNNTQLNDLMKYDLLKIS